MLGWEFFEKLGQQRVMQVQSSTDPPKKLERGERSIMADGNEYNLFMIKEAGGPIEVVYAEEGTPITIGHGALLARAPNPTRRSSSTSSCTRRRRSSSCPTWAGCAPSTRA